MIENIENLKAMMEIATESMTGRQVKICLHMPLVKGYLGQAYIAADGSLTFDINPDLDLEDFYHVWLHETGHALFHLENATPRELPPEIEKAYLEKGSLFEQSEEEKKAYDENPQEQEAENFYRSLDHYAQQKAMDLFFEDGIQTRIRVLTKIAIRLGE